MKISEYPEPMPRHSHKTDNLIINLLLINRINNNSQTRTPVKIRHQTPISLLPTSIPNLQLYDLLIDLHIEYKVLKPNSGDKVIIKQILSRLHC